VLSVTINAGIGDIVHSFAMLEAARARHSEIQVAVDHVGLAGARNASHNDFAHQLATHVFSDPAYTIVPQQTAGATPESLQQQGLPMAVPDLRDVLPLPGTPKPKPYVAVTTKVRGWRIQNYLAIRGQFLWRLALLAERLPLVLVGERVLTETPEYHGHGRGFAYSIYEDLRLLPCIDATFQAYGNEPCQWDQFRVDCTTMHHAELVVVLGTGGNCSMAMACGRVLCLTQNTEMETYFHDMPADDRITLCRSPDQYLEELSRA
jgi:hypothetical protein